MTDQGRRDRGLNKEDLSDRGAGNPPSDRRQSGHGIERILVALDPSEHSLAALEAAARMAGRLDADLVGLFVEDVNVRRLAELPFIQEVGLFTATCRRVEVQRLSRQLRVQAGAVRRRFTAATRSIATRCTFREVRGAVAPEVLRAASEADVIVLGKGAWSPFETGRLAPAVRRVLSEAPASTLILRAEAHVEPPMRVVYDGTPLGDKAVATAAALAEGEDGHLTILLLTDEPDRASRLRMTIQERLVGTDLEAEFQTLTETSVSRLAYLVAREERGTLVLPAHGETLEDEALLGFLDETQAPVLFIR
ncbi:MAG: universal stress protein [Chloroflexota bacterium]|nr:universal stress protein [Chloroflexota bacterium]